MSSKTILKTVEALKEVIYKQYNKLVSTANSSIKTAEQQDGIGTLCENIIGLMEFSEKLKKDFMPKNEKLEMVEKICEISRINMLEFSENEFPKELYQMHVVARAATYYMNMTEVNPSGKAMD